MADFTPNTVFPGYVSNGSHIIFPIANLKTLSSALADAESGDVRAVIRAILEKAIESFPAESSASDQESTQLPFSIERTVNFVDFTSCEISYKIDFSLAVNPESLSIESVNAANVA